MPRRTSMQASNPKDSADQPPKTARIAVTFEPAKWQQPQPVELKSASVNIEPTAFFRRLVLPDRGVPYSPLND